MMRIAVHEHFDVRNANYQNRNKDWPVNIDMNDNVTEYDSNDDNDNIGNNNDNSIKVMMVTSVKVKTNRTNIIFRN